MRLVAAALLLAGCSQAPADNAAAPTAAATSPPPRLTIDQATLDRMARNARTAVSAQEAVRCQREPCPAATMPPAPPRRPTAAQDAEASRLTKEMLDGMERRRLEARVDELERQQR